MENFRNTLRETIDSGDYEGFLRTIDLGHKKAKKNKENERKFYDILEKGKNRLKKIGKSKNSRDIKNALIIINNYIENHKYIENLKYKEYTYAYHVLSKNRDLESFKMLVKKYPQFLNTLDENDNSLLYNIVLDFINTLDLYYLKVIAYLLESLSPYYIEKDIQKLEDIIELDVNKNYDNIRELRLLSNLFDHYLNQDKKIVNKEKITSVEKPSIKSSYKKELDRIDYLDRENLTDIYTFTLSNDWEAFSINAEGDKRKIYIHLIDLEKYIDKNSDANYYAAHKVFGCIFDEEYLNEYVNFKSEFNRLALTIEFEFDKNEKLQNTKVYESVINVNEKLSEDDEKTLKLKNIFESLFGFEDNNTKQKLHHFVEEKLAKICEEDRIPVIFRNIYLECSIEDIMKLSGTSNYTKNFWSEETSLSDDLIKELNRETGRVSYGKADLTSDKREVVILDPGHNYLALFNTRMIKKYLIDKEYKEELGQDRESVITNATIADAVNRKKCR